MEMRAGNTLALAAIERRHSCARSNPGCECARPTSWIPASAGIAARAVLEFREGDGIRLPFIIQHSSFHIHHSGLIHPSAFILRLSPHPTLPPQAEEGVF